MERALDGLAGIILRYGDRGRELLPLYRRLQNELEEMRADADLMSEVRARAIRSKDRTAERSC